MAYRCDQAIFGGARDAIRCKVSGSVCAHQKLCMMEGRIVLTDRAMRCPARDGKLPEDPAQGAGKPAVQGTDPAAAAAKPAARKTTAAGKKTTTGKTAGRKPAKG